MNPVCIEYSEEESAMDRVLFIIKDQLPKDVVDEMHEPLSKLKAVRSLQDMVAFILIEFNTKVDADAAKSKGFQFIRGGQTNKIDFVNHGVIAFYMKKICKDGVGTGN